ncbi:hypothetical protein AC579_7786 [Pseudocercospora musae]|uniref:Uncharacterized protein n=1 Tax=Pseudocercospora musae TaxID=113226 RepID=A0A139IJT7_9PEZI|nr:hypothetical protein AC579_7786 [Pseudocercospora musae]
MKKHCIPIIALMDFEFFCHSVYLDSTSKAVSKGHQIMVQAKSNESTGTNIIKSRVEETSTTPDYDAEGNLSASKPNTKDVSKPAGSNM